jgi:hypothetical protein
MLGNDLLHVWKAGATLQKWRACVACCWKIKLSSEFRMPHTHNSVSNLITFQTSFMTKGADTSWTWMISLCLLKIYYHQSIHKPEKNISICVLTHWHLSDSTKWLSYPWKSENIYKII